MRRILIVEDEVLLREGYGIVLSVEPYEVHMAADGGEALRLCQSIKFDLILLDLMMPKVSGVTFLERLGELDISRPKIIIMSNLSSGEDLSKALALGAHKSVVKANLSPRQLLSMIRYELASG